MGDRFLITGATGFVGSCIVRDLLSQKKHVSIITRHKKLNWRLYDIASQLKIYEGDLRSQSLKKIIDKIRPTYIFHLAAYGSLPAENDVGRMIDTNIKGTINLINALKRHHFELFVNTGTSSEYGICNHQMGESDVVEPINDYGCTKAAATLFCQKEARHYNLPIITFRLFSPYGYFEDERRLVPWVILKALKNQPVELSSPNHVRDFIFIQDVVDAYLKATQIKIGPGEIFNLGTGRQHSVLEVVNTILQITKSKAKIVWGKVKKQERQLEPVYWEADISKAIKTLRWKPKYDLEEGLEKTVRWFNKNINLYAY